MQQKNCWERYFLCGPCRGYKMSSNWDDFGDHTRVKAGSNTFTVTLRVVGETKREVSYLRQYNMVANTKGLGPEKHYAGKSQ
jgi:hypothetical protein